AFPAERESGQEVLPGRRSGRASLGERQERYSSGVGLLVDEGLPDGWADHLSPVCPEARVAGVLEHAGHVVVPPPSSGRRGEPQFIPSPGDAFERCPLEEVLVRAANVLGLSLVHRHAVGAVAERATPAGWPALLRRLLLRALLTGAFAL